MKEKFCVNCIYCVERYKNRYVCVKEFKSEVVYEPVTGKPELKVHQWFEGCGQARRFSCGPEAKWFKAKPIFPWWNLIEKYKEKQRIRNIFRGIE
jgi:hypothetical protein